MGNQISEAHDKFRNEPALPMPKEFVPNTQGFKLSNHHTEGPSKVGHGRHLVRVNLVVDACICNV